MKWWNNFVRHRWKLSRSVLCWKIFSLYDMCICIKFLFSSQRTYVCSVSSCFHDFAITWIIRLLSRINNADNIYRAADNSLYRENRLQYLLEKIAWCLSVIRGIHIGVFRNSWRVRIYTDVKSSTQKQYFLSFILWILTKSIRLLEVTK